MYKDKYGGGYCLLTEEGIDLGNGEIIREGRVLEYAREMAECNDDHALLDLSNQSVKELSREDSSLLHRLMLMPPEDDAVCYLCDAIDDAYTRLIKARPDLWVPINEAAENDDETPLPEDAGWASKEEADAFYVRFNEFKKEAQTRALARKAAENK